MAFLSQAASTTPIKQPDAEPWYVSLGRKLPGMIVRAGGTVGGAALGGAMGGTPVGIAAGGAGGSLASEPLASGADAIFAPTPQAATGGEPTPIARALASRRNALRDRYRADLDTPEV